MYLYGTAKALVSHLMGGFPGLNARPDYDRAALVVQLAFYALSLVGLAGMKLGPVARASDAAFTFVVLNTAAVVAFANFVTGRKVAWTR